jgi:hypothetical protein
MYLLRGMTMIFARTLIHSLVYSLEMRQMLVNVSPSVVVHCGLLLLPHTTSASGHEIKWKANNEAQEASIGEGLDAVFACAFLCLRQVILQTHIRCAMHVIQLLRSLFPTLTTKLEYRCFEIRATHL